MNTYLITVRARWPHRPFEDRELCVEAWARLRTALPKVLACVLMPNHLHLLREVADEGVGEGDAQAGLVNQLRGLTRKHFPGTKLWEPASARRVAPGRVHLMRNIRYVHMNPCRAGIVGDPLEWEWSTHRDYLGLAAPVWSEPSGLRLWKGDLREFHRYVSSDPSADVKGTRFPASPQAAALFALPLLVRAVTIARRGRAALDMDARRLIVALGSKVSRASRAELAAALDVSERTVYRIAANPPVAGDRETTLAILRILADPRLMARRG